MEYLDGHGGQLPSAPLGLLGKDVGAQVLGKADTQDLDINIVTSLVY